MGVERECSGDVLDFNVAQVSSLLLAAANTAVSKRWLERNEGWLAVGTRGVVPDLANPRCIGEESWQSGLKRRFIGGSWAWRTGAGVASIPCLRHTFTPLEITW